MQTSFLSKDLSSARGALLKYTVPSSPPPVVVCIVCYWSKKYMEIGPKDVRGWQIASPINARTLRKKKKKKKKKNF